MTNKRHWIYLILMTVALIGLGMLLGQMPAHAQFTCPSSENGNDTDKDGLTDYQECNGIVLNDGTCICGSIACCPTGCPTGGCTAYRYDRLNPTVQDVFVILVPQAGGYFQYLPAPLVYVSNPTSAQGGGLGITVHQINQNQAFTYTTPPPPSNRYVTSQQQALRVTESLNNTSTNPLGFANTGTPNGPDLATVYTQRINTFISTTCGTGAGGAYGTPNCADSTGVRDNSSSTDPKTKYALTLKYILHTINHEVGHMLGPLAPTYNANYGGYHYVAGTNSIMDQSVSYTSTGGQFIFSIGTIFTTTDEGGVNLLKSGTGGQNQ